MSRWLEKYHDCEVEILYLTDNNVYRDRGRLTDMGDGWIELTKPSAETFLVPVTAVRLMKLIGQPDDPAGRLLRPAVVCPDEPHDSDPQTDEECPSISGPEKPAEPKRITPGR